MTDLPGSPALIRTWFGDDAAWDSLVAKVRTPSEDGFLAHVTLVNDAAFEGLTAAALKTEQPAGSSVSFLADETTMASAGHPMLAVWVYDDRPDHEPFRVIPGAMWSVENNINIANMDWPDFTNSLDRDGVFRGF